MKYGQDTQLRDTVGSHLSRGAWIEIDIEVKVKQVKKSHPSRGAWIEIMIALAKLRAAIVAPLAGCVD